MRVLLLLATALALAWPAQAQIQSGPPADNPALAVTDQRPAEERRRRALSLNIGNCSYGIWNIGDDGEGFDRVGQMQRELASAIGQSSAGQTLTLRRYVVVLNAEYRLTAKSVAIGLGSVGQFGVSESPPASGLRPRCEQSRMPLGWFDSAELTNTHSPFVVHIEVEYRGQPYVLRTAYSPSTDLVYPRRVFKTEGIEESKRAMTKANLALAQLMLASGDASPEPAK